MSCHASGDFWNLSCQNMRMTEDADEERIPSRMHKLSPRILSRLPHIRLGQSGPHLSVSSSIAPVLCSIHTRLVMRHLPNTPYNQCQCNFSTKLPSNILRNGKKKSLFVTNRTSGVWFQISYYQCRIALRCPTRHRQVLSMQWLKIW